jgi:hypothetical protein
MVMILHKFMLQIYSLERMDSLPHFRRY